MTGKDAKQRLKKAYDYRNQYTKENYDRISLTVPKGTRETIKELLPEKETVNGLINKLINQWILEHKIFSDFPPLE